MANVLAPRIPPGKLVGLRAKRQITHPCVTCLKTPFQPVESDLR